MNLRVDLLLDHERRSTSLISPKMVLRSIGVTIPILLGILLGAQILTVHQLRGELNDLNLSYESAKPQQERAQELVTEFKTHRAILDELTSWTNSRVVWHPQLVALMTAVPTNVQLRTLGVNQTLQLTEQMVPVRLYVLTLDGRAVGAQAESSVKRLEDELRSGAAFQGFTTNVTVPQYGADTATGASRDDRVFGIACKYRERPFQ